MNTVETPTVDTTNVIDFAEWKARITAQRDEQRLEQERERFINLLLREFAL